MEKMSARKNLPSKLRVLFMLCFAFTVFGMRQVCGVERLKPVPVRSDLSL